MRRLVIAALLLFPAASVSADLVVERTWAAEPPIDPAPIEERSEVTVGRHLRGAASTTLSTGVGMPSRSGATKDIVGDTWPALPPPLPRAEPATRAAARVLEVLQEVEREQRDTRYQHRTDVRERAARYRWDCSGMVSWVLHRAAPAAARGIGGDRTSARGIFRLIARAPIGGQRRGWEQLGHIEDARPGDVFAWLTPPGSSSPHTGHTGFVLERPRPVPGLRDAYAIRIADSIVGPHQEDTRTADPDGGLGTGVMTFLTDGHGRATHFGWHGTRTAGYTRTAVIFGRVHR